MLGLSEGSLGVDSSSRVCVAVQSPNVEEGVGICKEKMASEEENLQTIVEKIGSFESEKVACTMEGSKSRDGVVEDSGMGKKNDEEGMVHELPPSVCGPLIFHRVNRSVRRMQQVEWNMGIVRTCLKFVELSYALEMIRRKILIILVCWKSPKLVGLMFLDQGGGRKGKTLTHENSLSKL